MKLTQKQRDELWGDDGPYSQANLKIETRILDDKVSRVFLIVEAEINPFTYRTIKKNLPKFKDDPAIPQLIDLAEYRGSKFGYVSYTFQAEYTDEDVMVEAKEHLDYTKKDIIKMHRFIMGLIDVS